MYFQRLSNTLKPHITHFKHLYTFIVTYYYALNIFKPIYTYYLLNVLIYSILSICLTIVMISLLVGFVGTLLLLLPYIITLDLSLLICSYSLA